MKFRLPATLLLSLLIGPLAIAQDEVNKAADESAAAVGDVTLAPSSDMKPGWHSTQKASAGANTLTNDNVVGQADGRTTIYNLNLSIDATEIADQTEWENSLSIAETFGKNPSIDRFVKTGDKLKASSFYKYFFSQGSTLGAFGKFEAETSIFDGYDERPSDETYVIAYQEDGKVETETADRFKLTEGFKPLTLKESFGLIAQLTKKQELKTEVRTGPGAKQIFAAGQLRLADDDTTDVIEVVELQDVTMLGWIVGAEMKGVLKEGKITYKFYADALYPISYTPKAEEGAEEPDAAKLISTDVGANLSYNMLAWLAMTYDFSSKREPLLLDQAQVSHSFLLTATYSNSTNP